MTVTPIENIRIAMSAVWKHRFRSLLTILGIVIGITTVVTVSSLLTGLRKGVVVFFDELGPDNIFIYKTSGDPNSMGVPEKERKRRPIHPEYGDSVRRAASSVGDVGLALYIPEIMNGKALSARVPGYEADEVSLVGVSSNMSSLSPRDIRLGRYFTPEEDSQGAHVAVIGNNLAEALFPDGRALEREFMLDGGSYTVIGVYAKAKGGFFGENGMDTQITVPIHTAQRRYPQVDRFMVIAKAKPGMRKQAFDEVEQIVRRVRKTPRHDPDDFSISTPDQIIAQFDQITSLIGLVAIAISALGLLVGGIGVMNIMLVSVTERTREIGVRKAIGARRRDIIGQFLTEAMALTSVGGALGIVISVLVTLLLGALVPSLPATVPAWAIVSGLLVSMSVGLFFGTWPAVKASRLDPVEALRYE